MKVHLVDLMLTLQSLKHKTTGEMNPENVEFNLHFPNKLSFLVHDDDWWWTLFLRSGESGGPSRGTGAQKRGVPGPALADSRYRSHADANAGVRRDGVAAFDDCRRLRFHRRSRQRHQRRRWGGATPRESPGLPRTRAGRGARRRRRTTFEVRVLDRILLWSTKEKSWNGEWRKKKFSSELS